VIEQIGALDVREAQKQIDAHPEAWDTYKGRTDRYGTPHGGVSDIWVRYNALRNLTDDWAAFHGEHVSEWYPVVADIPAAWSLARKVKRMVGASTLGGVLITRIPPGGEVKAHVDRGWHAEHYRKFGVQIRGDADQVFWFRDGDKAEELRPVDGDVYEFDNSVTHGVRNESTRERITLIVCCK